MTVEQRESNNELMVRAIAAERLTFFADAVIAIAITLLALNLSLPDGVTNGEVLRSALAHRDEYLAFVISFIVIAAHWRGHHLIFRYVTHLDGHLVGLTIAWLFAQVVLPFATRVLTGNGAFQSRFGFYSIVEILAFVFFMLMVREIQRHHLYRDIIPPDLFRNIYLRLLGFAAGFALSIPVSFFTHYSYVCWVVGPMVFRTAWHWQQRRRQTSAE
jgi:uncharacterized membrane protein